MWATVCGVLLSMVIIAGSYWYKYRDFIREKIQLLRVLYSMVTGVALTATPPPVVGMHMHASQRYAIFDYERMGLPYTMRVPYDASKMIAMRPLTVTLIGKDNTPHVITQQPGLPYLLSASQMEGLEIVATNNITGQRTVFASDAIPMYVVA